jgi:hypothetical protein
VRFPFRLIGLTIPLLAFFLPSCSPTSPDANEPPPRQVRRELARLLEDTERLQLTEFHKEEDGRYTAEAKSQGGATYHVEARVQNHTLVYKADGGGRLLGGRKVLPEPPFDESHPQAVQWLRGLALVIQAAGAVWPALGRFGLRRRYSSRTETLLAVFGAVNAACAAWWGYQIIINWGSA